MIVSNLLFVNNLGDFIEALQCLENVYVLTNGRPWQMDGSDKTFFSMACVCLQRVCTTAAMQVSKCLLM